MPPCTLYEILRIFHNTSYVCMCVRVCSYVCVCAGCCRVASYRMFCQTKWLCKDKQTNQDDSSKNNNSHNNIDNNTAQKCCQSTCKKITSYTERKRRVKRERERTEDKDKDQLNAIECASKQSISGSLIPSLCLSLLCLALSACRDTN